MDLRKCSPGYVDEAPDIENESEIDGGSQYVTAADANQETRSWISRAGIGDRSITPAAATMATATAATATATAAVPTAAAITAPAAPAVTAATTPRFPGLGFVDSQPTAIDLLVMERLDGRLGLLIAAHLHEAEALAAAGVAVVDDLDALHAPELREQLLQFGVADLVRQVPDIQFLAHRPLQDTEVDDPSRVTGVRSNRGRRVRPCRKEGE